MIKNIIFDFGGVLVDWNPHYLFDTYFNDEEKCNYFIENVCNTEWNAQMDKGKPFEVAVKERIAEFPEYEDAIRLYQSEWMKTMGEEIPGMYELIKSLKENGFPVIYGLTNWSAETFPPVREKYKIFSFRISSQKYCTYNITTKVSICQVICAHYGVNDYVSVRNIFRFMLTSCMQK